MNSEIFPVIDLSSLSQYAQWTEENQKKFIQDPVMINLSCQISEAFTKWGFIYIKNHGITEQCIRNAYSESKTFFKLNSTEKELVVRQNNNEPCGYVPFNVEVLDREGLLDLRECFDFIPDVTHGCDILNKLVPKFLSSSNCLFLACHHLSKLFLKLLSMQLPHILEKNFLDTAHSFIGKSNENMTMLRLLSYPAFSLSEEVSQPRCEEHTDYGTFTFLFQNGPGLQVMSPSGMYVDAPPIPGTIVVNAGDMLEKWSSRKFKSTLHRVVLKGKVNHARQSIAFFCLPNNNININCLDNSDQRYSLDKSNNIPSERFFDYLMKKYAETYG